MGLCRFRNLSKIKAAVWFPSTQFRSVYEKSGLAYVPREEIERTRREKPTNLFVFGKQRVTTRVFMMAPAQAVAISVDVVDYMWEARA